MQTVPLTTYSTVSGTTRDRIEARIASHVDRTGRDVPASVLALDLNSEDMCASELNTAQGDVLAQTPNNGEGLPCLWFALNDAFVEAIRKPAPGGGRS
jgi:hypothetical protein